MACVIELEIAAGSSPGQFIASVVNAPSGGGTSAAMHLDVDGLLRERDTFENMVLASAVSKRRILSGHEQQLRRVGLQLFESLFSGPVLGTYRASLVLAQQRSEPLRVVLRLTAPRLAALPWEALFDPETDTYICRRESLVRRVPAPFTPDPPLVVRAPLRVLGVVASPQGRAALDVAAERDHLLTALATPIAEHLIELDWVPQATWDGVHEKLLSNRWHVLHFIGHGEYDPTSDQGVIALVGEDGRAEIIEAERLVDLLHEARPMPQLVVLNSCSSGQQGMQDLFSGTAAALVRSGISAVAAMQFTVSDPAAIRFARGFYTAIAHGHSVDDATRAGRIAILRVPYSLEWVTPVLYVRGETTQLFTLTPPREASEETPPVHGPPKPVAAQPVSFFQRLNRRTKIVVAAVTVCLIVVGLAVWRPWQHRDTRTASVEPPTKSESVAPPTSESITITTQPPPPPPPTVEPTSAAGIPPTGLRQITYSVTGTKAPLDVITITFIDASGRSRQQHNVYIPWSFTLTAMSNSDVVGSVQASSLLGISQLNCSITASDGTVLSQRSDNSPVTSC
jgi:hypothetical protein